MRCTPQLNQQAYERVLPMLLSGAPNAEIMSICAQEFDWTPSRVAITAWRKKAGLIKERASLSFTPEEKALVERGNRVLRLIKPKHDKKVA